MKLWTDDPETADAVEEFLSGDSVAYDQRLVEWDILGSIAHTQMLHEQRYLSAEELAGLHAALLELYEAPPGLVAEQEDVHTAVEAAVTGQTEAGAKMHTGRSRNDQVAVDEHLYMKAHTLAVADAVLDVVEALADQAETHKDTVMPGYTHMQQAMPTTVGTWLSSTAVALLDDLQQLDAVYTVLDQSPLGAAAGYGTTLDVDRSRTAELLGFSSVQDNPVHAVNSRATAAVKVVQVLHQLMLDLETLANDLLLFSTDEFGFVDVPDAFCTGSSIMPQKSNPDVLELVTGKAAQIRGNQHAIEAVCSSTRTGYGTEMQAIKQPMMESFETTEQTFTVLAGLIDRLAFDEAAIEETMDESVYAAHTANQDVESGVPFREAYHSVKESQEYDEPAVDDIPAATVDQNAVNAAIEHWTAKQDAFQSSIDALINLAEENAAATG